MPYNKHGFFRCQSSLSTVLVGLCSDTPFRSGDLLPRYELRSDWALQPISGEHLPRALRPLAGNSPDVLAAYIVKHESVERLLWCHNRNPMDVIPWTSLLGYSMTYGSFMLIGTFSMTVSMTIYDTLSSILEKLQNLHKLTESSQVDWDIFAEEK